MRQDPPFHMGYITATHLLERIEGETLVVNNPRSVRNAPEKVMVLDYRRFMPPTLVTRSADEVRAFQRQHGAVVIKPIHGNGGKAIFRVPAEGDNLVARCSRCSTRPGPSRTWSSRSSPKWRRATSASC